MFGRWVRRLVAREVERALDLEVSAIVGEARQIVEHELGRLDLREFFAFSDLVEAVARLECDAVELEELGQAVRDLETMVEACEVEGAADRESICALVVRVDRLEGRGVRS